MFLKAELGTAEMKKIILVYNHDLKAKMDIKIEKLIDQLHLLEQEHRDLDEIITHIQEKKTINLLQIQRLKKRKRWEPIIISDNLSSARKDIRNQCNREWYMPWFDNMA